MSRLALPTVTLVAVDTRMPDLALQSLQRSLERVEFARAVLFTHGAMPPLPPVPPGVEVVDIGRIESAAAYSHFVLRRLADQVDTPHVLVTQWDGFVLDAAAWRPEFLEVDYIGAPWPHQPEHRAVGNGGFSLRSQRLLRAGRDPRIVDEHPEDFVLCRAERDRLEREHGIRFAPLALARHFAFENVPPVAPTFGFHGAGNLPHALDALTLADWLRRLPESFYRGRDARKLARTLLRRGQVALAREVIERRLAAGQRDLKTWGQWLAARLRRAA